MKIANHPYRDFASWAQTFSQHTNQSLAGANLVIDEPHDENDKSNALLRNQAAAWGMNVVKGDTTRDDVPFAYPYVPTSGIHEYDDGAGNTAPFKDMRKASGLDAMDYAQAHMPVTHKLMERLAKTVDFRGIRIATCLILEPKTAVLLRELKAAGTQVGVCCEPGGVDERVAEQLRAEDIVVEAKNDWTSAQYYDGALRLLDTLKPNIIIDDGASFARLAARERPEIVRNLIGVAEETTSGVRAFQAMQDDDALPYPVVAVNDSALKTEFDNAHGTGETCVTTIQEILGTQWFAGKNLTVIGYGPVGRGFALRVRALGAHVTICDTDPVACLKAVFEGFPTTNINEALPETDMAVSATGVRHTLALEHLHLMKPNAVLAVIGGIADEIALDDIPSFHHQPGLDITAIQVPDGPELRLLAQGDGVNYTAGGGNPIEIMDLSFAVQLSAVAHLISNRGNLPNQIIRLDAATDRKIASIALQVRGYQASHAIADNGYSWKTTRFDVMQD